MPKTPSPSGKGRPQLPNAPLVEVICELRFPGSFQVVNHMDQLQKALEQDFPVLRVPNAGDGEAPALKPCQFSSQKGEELIHVAINLFSFISKKYSVFPSFRTRFFELLSEFQKVHNPKKLNRFGLRYTNILPHRPGKFSRPHAWLNLEMAAPGVTGKPVTDIQFSSVVKFDEGLLRMMIATSKHGTEGPGEHPAGLMGSTLFDLDFSRQGEIGLEEVPALLDKGHDIIDGLFYKMLTKEALAGMMKP